MSNNIYNIPGGHIEANIKKLLCYKIINNNECSYKNKCMFAHNITEQKKDVYRELIYNMINVYENLSSINIFEDVELMDELVIYTKECKNCVINKCPGGYNCKFGACLKELVICYNDLCYGKCTNPLKVYTNANTNIKIHRCIHGIHLTEKKLLPYNQRITGNINIASFGENISYFNKQTIISIMINEFTINKIKNLLNKNNKMNNINIFQNYDSDKDTYDSLDLSTDDTESTFGDNDYKYNAKI